MTSFRERFGDVGEREPTLLTAVILIALGGRLAVAVLTTSWIFSDADHYWSFGYEMGAIGAALADGDGFAWPPWSKFPGQPTAWMAPAYPWLIGAAFKLVGIYSVPAAVILLSFQTVVSLLNCVFLYLVGKRVFNRTVGLLAATMLALYPASIHFSVQKVWSTPLYVLCLLVVVYMFLRMVDRPTLRSSIVLGLVLGITALVDVIVFAFLPFALVWLYVASKRGRASVLGMVAGIVVVMGLTIAPWLARNYLVFDRLMFIKSNFGHELFIGNNPVATGGADDNHIAHDNLGALLGNEELRLLSEADESEYNRLLLGEATDWIRNNPERFVELTAIRAGRFWTTIKPPSGATEQIAFAAYLALLLLAGVGIIGVLRSGLGRGPALILLLIISLPLPYYFTLAAHVRYRFPVVPFLMLFAAHSLWIQWRHVRRSQGVLR